MRTLTEDLLVMLQHCANKLLLAYDETLRPDVWEAFERTAEAGFNYRNGAKAT